LRPQNRGVQQLLDPAVALDVVGVAGRGDPLRRYADEQMHPDARALAEPPAGAAEVAVAEVLRETVHPVPAEGHHSS